MIEPELINTGLKTIAMLFIVLGVLVVVLYTMKKFMSPKGKGKGELIIKVVSSLYLSPKERVEVIEISGERIVVGITPGNINFLTKLNGGYKEGNGIVEYVENYQGINS
ncbi:MAG: flagellar biosynthetic protein FliO [Deltaproteobacteria bacterium]|jgi:flagellar biosynthetic protein FliO|nr:flagellar biosynthetic protein FliO [Deltaproteobacteria bacterium]